MLKTISAPLYQGLILWYSLISHGQSLKRAIKISKCSLTFPLHHSHYQSTEMTKVTLNTHLHYFLLVSAKTRTIIIRITLFNCLIIKALSTLHISVDDPLKSIFLNRAQVAANQLFWHLSYKGSKLDTKNTYIVELNFTPLYRAALQSHDYNTIAFQPIKCHVL